MEPAAGVEDGEWVRRSLAGDREAFEALVRRYQKQAVAVSYRLLGNSADAQEVTQDAFLKAFRGLSGLQTPDAFGGWLLRIVSNLSLNFRRGRSLRQGQSVEDAVDAGEAFIAGGGLLSESTGFPDDPMDVAAGKELGVALTAALQQLPEKSRQALVLFAVEGRPQKQVADELGLSVEAVKWHVFQARKKLKELLADHL